MRDADGHIETYSERSLPRWLRRALFHSVIALGFAILFGAFIWLLQNRYYFWSAAACMFALMLAPFLLPGGSWRERVVGSLVIPFCFAGLAFGIISFIALSRFPWFEAVFNFKHGVGFGLSMFAFAFAVVSGRLGYHCINFAGRRLGYCGQFSYPAGKGVSTK